MIANLQFQCLSRPELQRNHSLLPKVILWLESQNGKYFLYLNFKFIHFYSQGYLSCSKLHRDSRTVDHVHSLASQ
jgi:hypothetical protein